jgi:hypothetical protein
MKISVISPRELQDNGINAVRPTFNISDCQDPTHVYNFEEKKCQNPDEILHCEDSRPIKTGFEFEYAVQSSFTEATFTDLTEVWEHSGCEGLRAVALMSPDDPNSTRGYMCETCREGFNRLIDGRCSQSEDDGGHVELSNVYGSVYVCNDRYVLESHGLRCHQEWDQNKKDCLVYKETTSASYECLTCMAGYTMNTTTNKCEFVPVTLTTGCSRQLTDPSTCFEC